VTLASEATGPFEAGANPEEQPESLMETEALLAIAPDTAPEAIEHPDVSPMNNESPQASESAPPADAPLFAVADADPITEPQLNAALLGLSDLLGAGMVRVDAEGRAWPLNLTGSNLLTELGGLEGEPAPDAVTERLAAAIEAGAPQVAETLPPTPEQRHVTVAAAAAGGGGIVALQDHTDERLLQERLLQSEKMASVGQLVSGVAHELNNPLTGVMGFAQLLLTRDLDDVVRSQIQTIYGEAERAAKIVQNLLSLARRRAPTKEMADVNALLQRVLELRSYDFTIRNINLDMTLDTRMARVWVDPDQVQQVFFNVIKNAEQSMIDANQGGRLTVVTRGTPESVRISISDEGPGIPPEIQRRIFDPFFTTK
jgi:signal transduction histidine kinase